MTKYNMQKVKISELCIEYRFGPNIDKSTSDRVLASYQHLLAQLDLDALSINDIVPTYTTIAIHFNTASPLFQRPHYLDELIQDANQTEPEEEVQTFKIEVDYCGEDLAHVCHKLKLSKQDFIDLHANRPYTIALLGFRPYFPYLLGLDNKLILPRRETPRTEVIKGAVAIAAGQTGIYSEASPGGWHIVGYTDFDGFEKLHPGDTILFTEKDNNVD